MSRSLHTVLSTKSWILIAVLVMSISGSVIAQDATLHLDKPYYTTGEVAWYKYYLPTEMADIPAKVEVQITDAGGNIITSYFLDNNGAASVDGYWDIPYTLPTASYAMSFIAYEKRGIQRVIIGTYDVPVYNDLTRIDKSSFAISEPATSSPVKSKATMTIKTVKTSYTPREEVTVDISVMDESGNPINGECSVSVTNMNLIGQGEILKAIKTRDRISLPSWTPTDRLVFRGEITDTAGTPISINVLGMYTDATQRMALGKSDVDGNYRVAMNDFYGEVKAQAVGYIINEADQLDIAPVTMGVKSTGVITSGDHIDNYIAASRLNKKIRQVYKTADDYAYTKVEDDILERDPNASYDFEEYKQFPSTSDFFNEANTSRLKFSSNSDGLIEAVMFNPKGVKRNFKYPHPPTFIVDGKVTRDANLVGRMPFEDVKGAELYFLSKSIKSTFGTNGGSGYAILTTKKDDFVLRKEERDDIISISGLLRPRSYGASVENVDSDNNPRFQPLVHWQPNVPITDGRATLDFTQSDDISSYIITVVARAANGNFVSKSLIYDVDMTK